MLITFRELLILQRRHDTCPLRRRNPAWPQFKTIELHKA
jgi:hypothetical protein